MIAGLVNANAQWSQVNFSLVDISVGSETNIVGVDNTNTITGNSGNLVQYNSTSGAWAYYTTEMGSLATITHASIAEDGTIWYRREANPGTLNLYRKAAAEGSFSLLNGHLTTISCASECLAVGSLLTGSTNIYSTTCAPVTFVLSNPNFTSSYSAVASDGTLVAISSQNSNGFISVGGAAFTIISPNMNLPITHIAVGDANKVVAVSDGNLYFKSGSNWIQDNSAPANIIKASVAADGTMALLTEGTNNLYFNHWDNVFCAVPAAPVLLTDSYVTTCAGGSVTLSVQDLGYDVEWYSSPITGGELIGTGTTLVFTPDVNGPNNSYVSPQYLNGGCISPRTPLLVGMITPPAIFTAPSVNSCPGVEITLNATTDSGLPVLWSTGEETNSITFTPNESTTIEVSTTYESCTTTETIEINISESPELMVTGPDIFCQPSGNIVQMVTLLVSGGSEQYTWSTGADGNVAFVLPTETTTYSVTSEIAPNCIATGEITIEYAIGSVTSIQVNSCPDIYPIIVEEIPYYEAGTYTEYLGTTISGCDSTRVVTIHEISTQLVLTDGTLYADNAGQTFEWFDCNNGSFITSSTDPFFTPTYSGPFNATILTYVNEIAGSCLVTTPCEAVTVGVNELADFTFDIAPNPAIDECRFNNIPVNAEILVMDATGKLVYATKSVTNTFVLSTEHLNTGLYIVQVKNANGFAATERLVVSK